jgi:EpsI family protein
MTATAKNSMRFGVLLGVLLLSGLVINLWERAGEAHVDRRELKEFPAQVGAWRQAGTDSRFDKETEAVLRADDYLSRSYSAPDGRLASFYVGYYATQRNGATYNSPLNCLPGSGWTMNSPATIEIKPKDGSPSFEANRYIIENGSDRQLLVYWYQGRGRKVSSEYWGKIYTVIDSVKRRRSDGAMVRIMLPVGADEQAALASAASLAAEVTPLLSGFVPD